MNGILIIDASESDRRLMSGLLVKSGYEPIAVETIEAAKDEVAKLPPGAVIDFPGHRHSEQPERSRPS